jgi:hypothetical protein
MRNMHKCHYEEEVILLRAFIQEVVDAHPLNRIGLFQERARKVVDYEHTDDEGGKRKN